MPLRCVQWKAPDGGQRNCPKHVEFYSKNKFEKLAHLVGFIIRSPKTNTFSSMLTALIFFSVLNVWTACFYSQWFIFILLMAGTLSVYQ